MNAQAGRGRRRCRLVLVTRAVARNAAGSVISSTATPITASHRISDSARLPDQRPKQNSVVRIRHDVVRVALRPATRMSITSPSITSIVRPSRQRSQRRSARRTPVPDRAPRSRSPGRSAPDRTGAAHWRWCRLRCVDDRDLPEVRWQLDLYVCAQAGQVVGPVGSFAEAREVGGRGQDAVRLELGDDRVHDREQVERQLAVGRREVLGVAVDDVQEAGVKTRR